MRCVSNGRSICIEVKDNSNVVFKLFCDVQSQKEPMNGEPEQFLCCSHFILGAKNKIQFPEMDKMSGLRMKSHLNWDLTVTEHNFQMLRKSISLFQCKARTGAS